MKVLVVKTSSMGDVIHTLPALTDAVNAVPGITFDWVVESAFQDIPGLHSAVDQVIVVNLRKWRKNPWRYRAEISQAKRQIQKKEYDLVIDAQGLIKSAVLTYFAHGPRYGLNKASCREPLAAIVYGHGISVSKGQHAITRVRQLFSKSLGYVEQGDVNYGLKKEDFSQQAELKEPYLVFLHGTTWPSKHWPAEHWAELIRYAEAAGLNVYLPWGNQKEHDQVDALSAISPVAKVLPKSSIGELTALMMYAKGVVGVDSGLAHLAAACGTAVVTLYGSTSAVLTGTVGKNNQCLQADFACSPCLDKACQFSGASTVSPACYESLNPIMVWAELKGLML